MLRFYNNKAIQDILREEPSLRHELYLVIDSVRKSLMTFDNLGFVKAFSEYLQVYDICRSCADLPQTKDFQVSSKVKNSD